MPRVCTVCTHSDLKAINRALVAGTTCPAVASLYHLSHDAVQRHKDSHLPKTLTKAKEAKEASNADDLLAQVRTLQGKATTLLLAAESEGDYRTALAGIREARGCVELLAKLMGELSDAPTVNITINPQWIELRTVIVQALQPYPEARQAVAKVLCAHGEGGE